MRINCSAGRELQPAARKVPTQARTKPERKGAVVVLFINELYSFLISFASKRDKAPVIRFQQLKCNLPISVGIEIQAS